MHWPPRLSPRGMGYRLPGCVPTRFQRQGLQVAQSLVLGGKSLASAAATFGSWNRHQAFSEIQTGNRHPVKHDAPGPDLRRRTPSQALESDEPVLVVSGRGIAGAFRELTVTSAISWTYRNRRSTVTAGPRKSESWLLCVPCEVLLWCAVKLPPTGSQ